jgi:hypothetical protein
MRINWYIVLKWILFLLIIIAATVTNVNGSSSAQWPNCSFQCRAGDVVVKDVWLGDSQGNSLPPCSSGKQLTADIWATFENNANAPRYAIILLADIYVDGFLRQSFYDQGKCVVDSVPPKSVKSMPLCSLSWNCGQKVEIKRLVISWETANGTNCSNAKRTCSNRNTKCSKSPGNETPVSMPLVTDPMLVSAINITKSILKNPVEKGTEAIYNYRIENQGKSDLKNITVIDSTFGEVFGPLHGDENGDGRLNVGETWIYQIIFRPLANATSNARVYAIDPNGEAIFAESAEVTVNVTSPEQTLQCQILGLNIVCEDIAAVYAPRIKGESIKAFNFTWQIDGSEIADVSNNGEISIPWAVYGGGYHILQLTAERSNDSQKKDGYDKKDQAAACEMSVLVVEVPSAAIEMDGG